ncbi:nucleoside-diphosphate-sugar epimerase family protein [Aspergillus steynii IBT 23096]|uniref:Nucleoside-diphosphate-sugar epimerase family protein n=1 Tax=Aspergillus steynii IBT 23096 TaxID=1392250 RepID=A0A2I2G6D8_9EURO|nr:nucleoside-diphosphate-sugar epimerase family protein [Aspergillus steynii IBT 23096]PLB48432.1 nucleoside-diphosphate-sugar epimerase family protein [Aspergillus steynii IBT 23096]
MKAIIVTGATGKQGSSVIRNLISKDAPFEVLAVTRDVNSPSAQRLAKLSPKIKLIEGNLDQPVDIFENARTASDHPLWGLFSVQVAIGNTSSEETQGKNLIDEAIRQNVKFLVYSSVDRGGDAVSFTNPTKIPHFVKKHNIEHHLVSAAKDTDTAWFILRPTAFYENLVPGFMGKVFTTAWSMTLKGKPLQLVATSDIGYLAAEAFVNHEKYQGTAVSLAGDELTYEDMARIFKEKTGQSVPGTFRAVCSVLMAAMKDFGVMFRWFRDEGYQADIGDLRAKYPGLKDFGTWLETESEWKK